MNGGGDEVWIKVWEIRFVSFCRFVLTTKVFCAEEIEYEVFL